LNPRLIDATPLSLAAQPETHRLTIWTTVVRIGPTRSLEIFRLKSISAPGVRIEELEAASLIARRFQFIETPIYKIAAATSSSVPMFGPTCSVTLTGFVMPATSSPKAAKVNWYTPLTGALKLPP
jgi:hypothetical protein